jgi:hypothetical protein
MMQMIAGMRTAGKNFVTMGDAFTICGDVDAKPWEASFPDKHYKSMKLLVNRDTR